MNLDLTDEEVAALLRELTNIIENDRYPLSPRIRTLRELRAKLPAAPATPPSPKAASHGQTPALGYRLAVHTRVHSHAGVI
jgi:hypothetical protein